ncbi:MAG: lysozyme inhibitor LprI family protein [Methylobacter sp.]|nr:lysozyme inhibitor LprI family protein [Methylobacter sp.]
MKNLIRMNNPKTLLFITISVGILLFTLESHAAGFNCAKASTFVEKTICSEKQLSDLDDLLAQTYKKAASNVTDKKTLKSEQLVWLKNRNQCKDTDCLKDVYEERIKELDLPIAQKTASKNVVQGRCHMNSCWWWKIEKQETIQSESKGELVKVYVSTTTIDYSDSEIDSKGYPDFPPEKSQWEDKSEAFVFCSKKLPAYIAYDEEIKKFTGTVPFDQDGASAGATEGIGNLYSYICNKGKEPKFEISSELEFSEITLETPKDIFKYPMK